MDLRQSIQTNKTVRELPLYVRRRMQGVYNGSAADPRLGPQ